VKDQIDADDIQSYEKVAQYINASNVDVVNLLRPSLATVEIIRDEGLLENAKNTVRDKWSPILSLGGAAR